ncbi:MAG: hypothetical protein IKD72_09730 [Clostridia bacterium]|nr:hypothetical protein [Clostridia bacterium]
MAKLSSILLSLTIFFSSFSGAGGPGAKGNKAVYLGYKTTTDKDDAITDLALGALISGIAVAVTGKKKKSEAAA